jgi:molybdate/tungstate transport system substrate-binding protein
MGDDRYTKQIFPEEILKTILQQSQLDAVAAYKHEAVAKGLPYITLPPQINLADPTFIDFYKKGSYTWKRVVRQYTVNQSISRLQFLLP